MVRYRPNPRKFAPGQLVRWQPSISPFRSISFWYTYHRFYDIGLKYPGTGAGLTILAILIPYYLYRGYKSYNSPSNDPLFHKSSEYLHTYSWWVLDTRKIRGEWNNNFACWNGSPDCGKDYKKRYFS